MKIFSDFHHAGCARGLALVLQWRLGHELYFPGGNFVRNLVAGGLQEGVLLPCIPSWLIGLGGYPSEGLDENMAWNNIIDDMDEFMEIDWDIFLCTRTETQELFRAFKAKHPHGDKIKMVFMTGNDGVRFDYDFIPNLMATDEPTYDIAPDNINKILYSQEIGRQYMGGGFQPITEESLHTINSFINCWPTMIGPWRWDFHSGPYGGICPHCGHPPSLDQMMEPVSPYGIWEEARDKMPEVIFNDYGIRCSMGCKPEVQLPVEYKRAALTIHMKTYDGYGFSMLQSIACGRLVVVPRKFHRYRTAGKYLIPHLTCLECDWDSDSLVNIIKYMTDDLDRLNEYSQACYNASLGLFQWDLEACRVRDFLNRLM